MEPVTFTVNLEDNNKRIDSYLTSLLNGYSRNTVQKYIDDKKVTVNGKTIKANYKLHAGDVICFAEPEPVSLDVTPEPMTLDILYEDKHLIVLNKPKGIVVHPAHGHYTGTLVNGLLYHTKGQLSGINGVLRPGIVHRIDKDTSGVLVVAKTAFAHQHLAAQLAAHTMTRKYHAIVHGRLKEDGAINQPIGRHPVDRKKMSIHPQGGKAAITHYHILEQLKEFTYIEATLETGRTHQIRVHMASIGHPLVGDMTYGSGRNRFGLQGQALHAKTLGFIHPDTKTYMEFNTQLPESFVAILKKIR